MIREILIPKKTAAWIEQTLNTIPESEDDTFTETYTVSADFGNGIEVDVKLCGVRFMDDSDNLPWTEAVIFNNGSEVCCSEPSDEFFGEWAFDIDGAEYVVVVKRGDERKDENVNEFLRRILPESEYEAMTTLTAWERRQAEWN